MKVFLVRTITQLLIMIVITLQRLGGLQQLLDNFLFSEVLDM